MRGKRIAVLPLLTAAVFLFAGAALNHSWASPANSSLGMFEASGDVGTVLHPGSVDYDASTATYALTGSGENIWFKADAFQFVWKKMSGDITLTADISFPTTTGNPHKKAVLMLRQSLDADSVYADVALHGNGMTALQFRDEKGGLRGKSNRIYLRRDDCASPERGDYVYMALAAAEGEPTVAGGWLRVPLQGTFYVGIGVCSHDKDVIEKASFSKVELTAAAPSAGQPTLYSTLETVAVKSVERQVVYIAPEHFEAPNWTPRRIILDIQSGWTHPANASRRRQARDHRYRFCQSLQQRSRHLARCHPARHQRRVTGRARVPRLYGADRRWHAQAHHEKFAVVLAWLVARRKDAGFRWPA